METLHVLVTALIAIYFIAVAGEGELFGPAGPLVRLLAGVAALLLLWSSLPTDVLGLAIAAGLVLWRRAG
ncbi:MAG: TRAP transporter permease, partial [Rhodobacteraceae bacterium]|nr:TRAP transporter permease [Paracoccaceae bacterium]